MNDSTETDNRGNGGPASRRAFLQRSTAVMAGGLVAGLSVARGAHATGSDVIRLGLVGCGGRGTGAAKQALLADRGARLVAVSDAFTDRIQNCLRGLKKQSDGAKHHI